MYILIKELLSWDDRATNYTVPRTELDLLQRYTVQNVYIYVYVYICLFIQNQRTMKQCFNNYKNIYNRAVVLLLKGAIIYYFARAHLDFGLQKQRAIRR